MIAAIIRKNDNLLTELWANLPADVRKAIATEVRGDVGQVTLGWLAKITAGVRGAGR